MNKLRYLSLFIFLQIAFMASCAECYNPTQEISIFDKLIDDEINMDAFNSPYLPPVNRKGQKISQRIKEFFTNPGNRKRNENNKMKPKRLKAFLESSVDLTSIDNLGYNILHHALENTVYDFDTIKSIVEALQKRYPNKVKMLLNQEAENTPDGTTPFTASIHTRDAKILEFLEKQGAKSTPMENRKALFMTIEANNLDMFKYILDKGTSPDFDKVIIKHLAKSAKPDLMEYFLDNRKDFNPEETDENNNTLLHHTSLQMDEISARLLLDKLPSRYKLLLRQDSSFINYKNKDGDTALHIAVKKCSLGLVSTLLRYGANSEITDRNGQTALEIAEQNLKTNQTPVAENTSPKGIVDKLRMRGTRKKYMTIAELEAID